jgi:membrane associated rhomboid family serine protease
MLTAAFLHDTVFLPHIAFNMYALWLFGPQLERLLGRSRYIALYVLSALGGSALSYAFSGAGMNAVGASGAVFGLFGAFFVVARRLRADTTQIAGLIGINLVLGFVIKGIDWRAHLGGLVTGAAVAAILAAIARPQRRALLQGAALAGVAVLIVGVVVWKTAQLHDRFGPGPTIRAVQTSLESPRAPR